MPMSIFSKDLTVLLLSLLIEYIYLTSSSLINFFDSLIIGSVKFSFSSKDITLSPYFSKNLNKSLSTIIVLYSESVTNCFNSASNFYSSYCNVS